MIEGIKKALPAHYFKIEDNKLAFEKYHTIEFDEKDVNIFAFGIKFIIEENRDVLK